MNSKFTKKHYIDIAEIFNNQIAQIKQDREIEIKMMLLNDVIIDFANMFAQDNHKFDKQHFIYACNK
jgi:hypothetical protein